MAALDETIGNAETAKRKRVSKTPCRASNRDTPALRILRSATGAKTNNATEAAAISTIVATAPVAVAMGVARRENL